MPTSLPCTTDGGQPNLDVPTSGRAADGADDERMRAGGESGIRATATHHRSGRRSWHARSAPRSADPSEQEHHDQTEPDQPGDPHRDSVTVAVAARHAYSSSSSSGPSSPVVTAVERPSAARTIPRTSAMYRRTS